MDRKVYGGVTNVGFNPTFGDNKLSIETFILDFSEDIVGKKIKIRFLQRLRDEKTFGSVRELTDQIALDVQDARKVLSASPESAARGASS